MLYACDAAWWNEHFAEVATHFVGERWTISEPARDRYDLNWIRGIDQPGLSTTSDQLHTGMNSGYQAIGLAVQFHVKRILLLGFDFARSNGRSHWHGDHPRGLSNASRFPSWVQAMNGLAQDAAARGIEIINCSRKSALTCFRVSSIQDALP